MARGRAGYVALSFAPVAALILGVALPFLVAVVVVGCLVVIAGGAAWDAIVLVGLAIDAGNRYVIRCVDDEIMCTSPGPDRTRGTEDDIVVPYTDGDATAPGYAPVR
jgi:hypothetical protein